MKKLVSLVVCLAVVVSCLARFGTVVYAETGEVLYENGFNNQSDLNEWSGVYVLKEYLYLVY